MSEIKLQNNFTTPEQSKRLLELGVPADSADQVYYEDIMWGAHEFLSPEHPYSETVKGHENVATPCWSVGRLIEIFSKCYTGAKCYYSPRNLYKTEFWMERFNRLNKIGFMDFSKLEE